VQSDLLLHLHFHLHILYM